MRRTKAQAQATRDKLIEVASQLIEINGLSHTTLEDIASIAGVTRGAISWHFKTRENLVEAVMTYGFRLIEDAIFLQPPPLYEPSMGGLTKHVEHLLKCIVADEQIRRFLSIIVLKVEYTDTYFAVRERIALIRDRYITMVSQSDAVRVLPDSGRKIFAIGLHAIIAGLVQHWILSPSAFQLVEVGKRTVQAYSTGILQDECSTTS